MYGKIASRERVVGSVFVFGRRTDESIYSRCVRRGGMVCVKRRRIFSRLRLPARVAVSRAPRLGTHGLATLNFWIVRSLYASLLYEFSPAPFFRVVAALCALWRGEGAVCFFFLFLYAARRAVLCTGERSFLWEETSSSVSLARADTMRYSCLRRGAPLDVSRPIGCNHSVFEGGSKDTELKTKTCR